MNKISKKIVALATMAAFVLTLVPAAAFAAHEPSTADVSYQASDIEVTVNGNAVTSETAIDAGDQIAVKFILRDGSGQTTSTAQDVRLWAVDSKGNITDALQDVSGQWKSSTLAGMTDTYYGNIANDDVYNFTFTRGDKYTLYVTALNYDNGTGVTSVDDLQKLAKIGVVELQVNDPEVVADRLAFWGKDGDNPLQPVSADNENIVTLDLLDPAQLGNFEFGVDTYTIEGFAYQKDDSRAAGVELSLSASRGSDVIDLDKTTVTTDSNGKFSITFKMRSEDNANIYVKGADVNYTIRVLAESSAAATIDTVEENGYVLAGDSEWWYEGATLFTNAVQFELKDANGNVLNTEDALTNEPAADKYGEEGAAHVDYLDITSVGNGSKITEADLVLAYDKDNGVYTLKYVGDDAEADLVPGKYTVEVGLLSKDWAVASFNVADFGDIEDVDLTMTAANNYGTDKDSHAITDEVTLGQKVTVKAWYVDANGIRVPAQDAQFGIDGKAVYQSSIQPVKGEAATGVFTTLNNEPANESLLGTQIIVSLFDDKAKQLAQETLTVVDAYNTYGLAFDSTQGPANEENKVTVSVVDADDNVANVRGTIEYYIADQSNEDANIDIAATDVTGGKGTLTIYSDKETTVDIVVAVKNATGAIYPATLEYTVGAEDINAENTVVMTIGSTDYVVNNDIVKGDAAPYVDEAWRTMVPFRVLGETFGATVDWDQDSQSVIYTYGDTELVMTIGEDTYTINGEEFNMDTAPVLDGDRTYVPVRFVGEALGYTVTALQDGETGLTASVVFQK